MAEISQIRLPNNTVLDLKDAAVPEWAKQATKPTYTAAEVGALPDTTVITDEKVKQTPLNNSQKARALLMGQNLGDTETTSITYMSNKLIWSDYFKTLTIYGTSSNNSYIKSSCLGYTNGTYSAEIQYPTLIGNYTYTLPQTTGTIALTSNIPTKLSDLTNDSGFITSYTETDPTVPAWAKATTKPTYTASEVGAVAETGGIMTGDLTIVKSRNIYFNQYSNKNTTDNKYDIRIFNFGYVQATETPILKLAPRSNSGHDVQLTGIADPSGNTDAANKKYVDDKFAAVSYPVTSVNTKTGAVTLSASDVGAMSTSHAANAITATDISNWNAKVSDDKTWNGVSLIKSAITDDSDYYVPGLIATSSTNANLIKITQSVTSRSIPRRDSSGYIKSTTPPATDNTTKVATTAYVTTAISNVKTPFIVTFTYDESLEATVCDKTYTEICNAIDNGNLIIGKQGSDTTTSYQDYRESGANKIGFHFNGQSMLSSDNSFTSISFFDYLCNVNSDNSVTASGVTSPAFEQQADFPVHIIQLTYYDTINNQSIYSSSETNSEVKTMIDNQEIVILASGRQYYYFSGYDRGAADLTFIGGQLGKEGFYPYKLETSYTNYWLLTSFVSRSLNEGILIATINGVEIYAPSYTDADGVSY